MKSGQKKNKMPEILSKFYFYWIQICRMLVITFQIEKAYIIFIFCNSLLLWFGSEKRLYFLATITVRGLVLAPLHAAQTEGSVYTAHCTAESSGSWCGSCQTLTECWRMVLHTGHLLSGYSHNFGNSMASLFSFRYRISKLCFSNLSCILHSTLSILLKAN